MDNSSFILAILFWEPLKEQIWQIEQIHIDSKEIDIVRKTKCELWMKKEVDFTVKFVVEIETM